MILHHVYGGEKAVPENVHSACPWNMDPTHAPAGGGEWGVYVCVCLQEGLSQLGEQDREVDDSRVFYFPWHFQKVASDYTTSSHS